MKTIITLLLILIFADSYSQDRFIEVTVYDTLLVPPDCYVYRINCMANLEDEVYNEERYKKPASFRKRQEIQNTKLKTTFDSVINLLKARGFHITQDSFTEEFDIQKDDVSFYSGDIKTCSSDSLRELYKIIKTIPFMSGSLISYWAMNENPYYEHLHKKLITKATDKAKSIASLAGLNISGIQSITEAKKENKSGGWTAYPPYPGVDSRKLPEFFSTAYSSDNLLNNFYTIEATFTVKFLIGQ
ncbi:hypothetical protein [Foetidibacter luteolus]|uniref:hypothetical protein n=1 Tax=Foetidibacter luteolus TaxID=2608880 RepID=UPI00129A4C7E|nr:hypothetical protein [Foetidibacter luteolus]